MSLPTQSTAVIAVLAIASVALFPLGTGPFTATHGPATTVRTITKIMLEFDLSSLLQRAALSFSTAQIEAAASPSIASGCERMPIVSRRC